MDNPLRSAKKILIIGDSGRGKTTFAQKLSEKMHIPVYSTDDFYWKTKFTEPAGRQESIEKITKVFSSDSWIVEGTTTHLFAPGLEKADLVLELVFRNIFEQWLSLVLRTKDRKDENIMGHLSYVTKKRFGIGNDKEKKKRQVLLPYKNKIHRVASYKALDRLLAP